MQNVTSAVPAKRRLAHSTHSAVSATHFRPSSNGGCSPAVALDRGLVPSHPTDRERWPIFPQERTPPLVCLSPSPRRISKRLARRPEALFGILRAGVRHHQLLLLRVSSPTRPRLPIPSNLERLQPGLPTSLARQLSPTPAPLVPTGLCDTNRARRPKAADCRTEAQTEGAFSPDAGGCCLLLVLHSAFSPLPPFPPFDSSSSHPLL